MLAAEVAPEPVFDWSRADEVITPSYSTANIAIVLLPDDLVATTEVEVSVLFCLYHIDVVILPMVTFEPICVSAVVPTFTSFMAPELKLLVITTTTNSLPLVGAAGSVAVREATAVDAF